MPAPLQNPCPSPDGCTSLCPLPVPASPGGCCAPVTSRLLPQGPFLSCAQLASLVCISLLEPNVYARHTCCQLARNINIPVAQQHSLPKDPPCRSARALPFLPSWDPRWLWWLLRAWRKGISPLKTIYLLSFIMISFNFEGT